MVSVLSYKLLPIDSRLASFFSVYICLARLFITVLAYNISILKCVILIWTVATTIDSCQLTSSYLFLGIYCIFLVFSPTSCCKVIATFIIKP